MSKQRVTCVPLEKIPHEQQLHERCQIGEQLFDGRFIKGVKTKGVGNDLCPFGEDPSMHDLRQNSWHFPLNNLAILSFVGKKVH